MNKSILRWERDFTQAVTRLAWPIMMQALVLALMQIVSNIMVGQLGEAELAGVTQAGKVTFQLTIILFGLVSGCSIFTAQFWGKRDMQGIRRMMGLSLMIAFGIALVFAIPSLLAPEWIMGLLIRDAAAQAVGVQYLRILSAVFIIDSVLLVEEAVLKSTEHVLLPMVAGITAISTSTLMNYLLIYGRFGFPRLGVRGGAISMVIGSSLQLLIMLVVSYKKRYPNAIRPRDLRLPPRAEIARYFRTVAPVLINETLWSTGVVMYSVAYGRMGASAVAAMSVFSNVEQLAFIALRGMTGACAILVGKAIGAGLMDEAQRNAKRFLAMNMLIGVFVGALVIAFAGNIVDLFNVSEQTGASARQIILFYGLCVWLSAGNNTLIVGTMRSGGDVVYSGILDVLFLWCVSVPLVSWFGPHAGLPIVQVYMLTKVDELLKFVVGLCRVLSGKWRHNLVEGPK